jgi:hypothetical protein
MKKLLFPVLLITLFLRPEIPPAQEITPESPAVYTVVIDPDSPMTEFEGIGAVSAGASSRLLIDYPEPYRSHILDYLFKPFFGAGFQHLKVEIGGDINSTDGTEPSHMRSSGEENYNRGYEWWLMKEALKRNPNIILDALAWGAPGWIGNGNLYSQEGADYFVSFLLGAKREHDLDIRYIGIWNEREFDTEWIKLFRETLDDKGLQDVKIVAADLNGPPERMWSIAEEMVRDPELAEAIHAIGVHYPHGITPKSAMELNKRGHPLWASEDGEWYWATMRPIPNLRAQKINMNYIQYHLTKTEFWSPVTSYYDCLPAPHSGVVTANTPWSGAFLVSPKLWTVAHTTQFAEPGWGYLQDACQTLPAGGSVVTLASPDRQDISMIIETTEATREQTLIIQPLGRFNHRSLSVWYSDALEKFIQSGPFELKDGQFTLLLKPNCSYSLTTTYGQRKGIHSSPAPAPFPLPYDDDFESYPQKATPKYLCDQGGAFEVEQMQDDGNCLRQQIERQGIDWSAATYAYSIIGDVNWNDIEISADAAFPEAVNDSTRFMQISARCYNGSTWDAFGTPFPVGYTLRLYGNGKWELAAVKRILATGRIDAPGAFWHHLKLICIGDSIHAYIDHVPITKINDATYQHGLVSIGSSFHRVAFDNLLIRDRKED